MDKTEALFVEVGQQMLDRNDWVTPWWNGEHFFDYPVWGYWMVALSFRLFGVSPWAARLPVALAASAVVVAVFVLILHWGDQREPRWQRWGRASASATVLATAPGWLGWGRTSTTDMFLSSAISLALLSFLLAHHEPPRSRLADLGRLGMALFCGVAVLAKGPVGVVLPLMVVVGFLVLSGQWRPWVQPVHLAAMLALFLAVCLPWYAAATRVNGLAFLWGFLGFSNLQRFTQVIYDHPGPPWFYLPWVLLLLLPWSLFLPGALVRLRFWRWSRWRSGGQPALPASSAGLFLLLWLAIPLAFFSLAATKLPGYILPIVPAGALLVSLSFWPLPGQPLSATLAPRTGDRWQRGAAGLEVVLLALMAVAAALAPRWVATDPAYPAFAAALAGSGLPLVLAALLGLTSLLLGVALLRTADGRWLWLTNVTGFLAILALVIAPLGPVIDRERLWPIRQLARQARDLARPNEPLWVVGTKRYSVLFYGGETAAFVSGRESLEDRLQEDPASLNLAPTSQTARLFGDRRHLEALEWPASRVQRLSRIGQQELWRVRLPNATRQEPL
ncbi:MAG: glycosyltransferase family 39 protein [Cyanobacteriota bacterium]|nr:glycosyltransferase family 39 protein [Cyanobacteriota bacterium]